MFAETPEPPYYAVSFTSIQGDNLEGYDAELAVIGELAARQPGFLGIESARTAEGFGITIVYYDSLEAIDGWRQNTDHRRAKAQGRKTWYDRYILRISRVESATDFQRQS